MQMYMTLIMVDQLPVNSDMEYEASRLCKSPGFLIDAY